MTRMQVGGGGVEQSLFTYARPTPAAPRLPDPVPDGAAAPSCANGSAEYITAGGSQWGDSC